MAWIEEEGRKEREAAQLAKDEKWMLEQLKKQNGDDFGEDIDLNFGNKRPFTISFFYRDGNQYGCFFTTRDSPIYAPMLS